MTVDLDALRAAAAPLVAPLGLEVYDVELTGSGRARVVRISVQRPDGTGIDLEVLSDATHAVEHAVEEAVTGAFQLEVSSPGLERKLSRPEHFRAAVGVDVSVKYRDESGAATRVRGRLAGTHHTDRTDRTERTQHTITILDEHGTELVIAYDDVIAARTVFDWGPAPRPGRTKPGANARVKETTRS